MVHHIIKTETIKRQCPYCKLDLGNATKWNSEFDFHLHYKKLTCQCGKKLWLKVDFIGSGHDDWQKQKRITIENLVKKDDFRAR